MRARPGGDALGLRVGLGQDLHPLVADRNFVLGGVPIPSDRGEAGHSDGDALCHALIDALLGAAGVGDIGERFPPGDPRWKDAHSLDLLREIWQELTSAGWSLVNADCVVVCEQPKILPYRDQIRESLAGALGVSADRIFVKGKTAEKLGVIGCGEAIAATCVVLLHHSRRNII